MAIPSKQIGQPSSTKAQLLWNISKQLESLTGVMGNISVTPGPPPSTTTTTTTANPGPTPSYTGTINVSTVTPGNELFVFRTLSQDNGQSTSATINWGDNTSDFYNIPPDTHTYFSHTYPSNGDWTVTVDFPNPAQLLTIDLDRNNNESPAVVTGYDFRNFDGITQLILNNNDALHTAATTGLFTLATLHATNADLESLSLVDGGNIATIYADNNNLSVLDLTPATSLQYLNLTNNQLLSVDISDSPNITYLDLSNNALSQAGIDAVLLSLVQHNQSNGYLDLRGSANDAPSSTGASLISTLQARGWEVYANASGGVQSTLMYFTRPGYDSYQALCYYDVASSKYVAYKTVVSDNPAPRTVYYSGTLGVNTVLWTNPEMTQFDINLFNGGTEVGAIFTDVAINVNDVNGSLQVYTLSYYGPSTNTVYSNPGTVASVSWNYDYFKQNGSIAPCDINWQQHQNLFYNTSTIDIGTRFAESYYNNGWFNPNWPYLSKYSNPTSVYQLSGAYVTAITPCTTTPVFAGAKWGYTQQEAIDGVNTFNLKPAGVNPWETPEDFTFIGCDGIKLADGTPMYQVISSGYFWVVYDGLIKQFYVDYTQGTYDRYSAPAVAPVTPPVTPYEIVITPGANCSSGFNPGNTITVYSNFPTIQRYATVYTDAARTTFPSWDWYAPQTGLAGYMYYDKWFYTQNC